MNVRKNYQSVSLSDIRESLRRYAFILNAIGGELGDEKEKLYNKLATGMEKIANYLPDSKNPDNLGVEFFTEEVSKMKVGSNEITLPDI